MDILSNDEEVQEVVKFVSDNAKRVLNVDAARVIPVSSRLALDAKLSVDDGSAGMAFQPLCSCHVLITESCIITLHQVSFSVGVPSHLTVVSCAYIAVEYRIMMSWLSCLIIML